MRALDAIVAYNKAYDITFWGWTTGHLLLLLGSNASRETLSL